MLKPLKLKNDILLKREVRLSTCEPTERYYTTCCKTINEKRTIEAMDDKIIEIDLIYLIKKELNINEYLTLYKLDKRVNGDDIPFTSSDACLASLENKGFIEQIENVIYLTRKANKLFASEVINFDDMYLLYPYKTPDGRDLRAKNKQVLGSLTKDYKTLSKKYHGMIKNVEIHSKVIEYTKRMLNSYRAKGSMNFLPKLETYLNQRGWERYAEEDKVPIGFGGNTEKL